MYKETDMEILKITKLRIENSIGLNLQDNSIIFSLKLLENIKQAVGIPTHDTIVAY
jgi:hypothetical protein